MAYNEKERWTRSAQLIQATPEEVFQAFLDPEILLKWLPPDEMTGVFHEFDPQVGAGYRMSLYYPQGDESYTGKSGDLEDQVIVRFEEIVPPRRIVESVRFVTNDPAMQGEMVQTITFESAKEGTLVTLLFEQLPPALRAADNDQGASISLGQLAALFRA